MTSLKGKVKTTIRCSTKDVRTGRTVGVSTLKVRPDDENTAVVVGNKKTSEPIKEGILTTSTSDLTGDLRISEKTKGKQDHSVIGNVRRKPLADLSNVKSSFQKSLAGNGSKPKTSTGACLKALNSFSGKSPQGNLKKASKESNVHTTMRGLKELTTASNYRSIKTNNHGRGTVVSNFRKSLPVLQRANQEDFTCRKEESTDGSEKAKRINGFPVKARVLKKAPQLTNKKSVTQSDRASDGFLIRRPSDQANLNAHTLSKKLTRPIVKAPFRTGVAQMTSVSKRVSVLRKPLSTAAKTQNKKEEASTSAPLIDNPVAFSCIIAQEDPPSNSNRKSTEKTAEASKTKRRRSYTSLLMSKSMSKLLENSSEVIKHGYLPSIDDNSNHLEVTQYIDDIYQYYWVLEAENSPLANYMSIQTEITSQMRGILINWLIEVHYKFELMPETLYLMVTVLDRYLSQVQIKKTDMQLVGLTSLLLASKYEDFWHPRIKDLISISAESYTRNQMLQMEKLILKKLKFRLNEPTPYVFMLRFLKAAQSDLKLEHLAFYLMEICLVEYEALKYKASMLCASAIFVARSSLQMSPPWTPLLVKHTRYGVSDIRECCEMILGFQKAAKRGGLRVTYEKYNADDLSRVAAVKPLEKLFQ